MGGGEGGGSLPVYCSQVKQSQEGHGTAKVGTLSKGRQVTSGYRNVPFTGMSLVGRYFMVFDELHNYPNRIYHPIWHVLLD